MWSDIPGQLAVMQAIHHIRAGEDFSFNDNKRANLEMMEKRDTDWLNRAEDIFHDSQGAFNNQASSLNPAKQTADKMQLDKPSPKKLPKGDGKFFQN